MKKFSVAAAFLLLVAGANAQTVFTYGNTAVSKEEFMRAFNKNPGDSGNRKNALKEYLDLYINFKLKVKAAIDEGLDKDPQQKMELANFRRQLTEGIINEQANVKDLVKETFNRSQKDIHLAHVFIEIPASGDTTNCIKNINAAYQALKEGKSFDKVAAEYSSDEATKKSSGDLGFITVFTLPYQIENIAYALQPDQYSTPVRTAFGYHIFMNKGERKPLGTRKVAQILIAFPPNANVYEKARSKSKADSVFQLIQNGEAFDNLVKVVSNDLSTSNNNGILPEFGIAQFDPVFEKAAFSLKNPGEVAKPFETEFGYHIIKLIEAKPVSTDPEDPETLAMLQQKVSNSDRLEEAKKGLLEKHLAAINYKKGNVSNKQLFNYIDTALVKDEKVVINGVTAGTTIFSFTKQNIKAGDFLKFVKAVKTAPNEYAAKSLEELAKEYVGITASEYYRNHMEEFNPEFKKQLNEFNEANLLFAAMEKNVWGKANSDASGLKQYYTQHKAKYNWAPSADAIIFTCSSEAVAAEMQQKLMLDFKNWRSISEAYENDVVADSGRYEFGQLLVKEKTHFNAGLITEPVKNDSEESYTFNYIVKVYQNPETKSFEEAKGQVIADYQQVLEDRWIQALKKKYPVVVNTAVFNSLK